MGRGGGGGPSYCQTYPNEALQKFGVRGVTIMRISTTFGRKQRKRQSEVAAPKLGPTQSGFRG